MIRCRDCGTSVIETEEDFALSGHELLESPAPTCPLCGAELDPESTDCASCTSALLDQLLKGPAASPPAGGSSSGVPWPSSAAAELRVRRVSRARPGAGSASADRSVARKARPARPTAPIPAPRSRKTNKRSVPQFAAQSRRSVADDFEPATTGGDTASESLASQDTVDDISTATVETSAACTALLASLAKADPILRCEIAVALGKLGDQEAVGPLERHLGDQDIRVRRAVAGALVQLGHPKGESLLAIAERTPAASMLMMAKPIPKSKPRISTGEGIDGGTLAKVGGAILAVALVGGGVWYWMNSPSSAKSKRAAKATKSAAAKKVAAPAAKKAVNVDD
jgi:nucleotide-binding universal stress UspA family protein